MRLRRWSLALLVGLAACNPGGEGAGGVAPRTRATPPGGTYPERADQRICLESDRPATIYFTLTGSIPSVQTADNRLGPTFFGRSPVCNIPILYDGMPLMFFAVDDAGNAEEVRVERYYLDTAPVCVATPEPGLYNVTQEVYISSEDTDGVEVYYTTDGSDPDPANPAATKAAAPAGPIRLDRTTQLKWRCVDAAGNLGEVAGGTFVIDTEPPVSEISPPPGFYYSADGDVPLEVQIRIANNDTGLVYYTTNGAVPTPDDPQGHTELAALEAVLQLEQSTIVRFTSVDKAGNAEDHGDGPPYHEAAYVLDDVPVVVATPPGGRYGETSLVVTLTVAPTDGTTVYYSLNGAAPVVYAGPITITGREAELRYWAERGTIVSPTQTAFYELGVGGISQTFTETFSTTDKLNMALTVHPNDNTTPIAEVDTSAGVVRLPRVRPSEQARSAVADNPPQNPALAWAQRVRYAAGVLPNYVAVLDGAAPNGQSGEAAAGVKLYDLGTNPNAPTLTFASALPLGTNEFFVDVGLLLSTGGTPLAAVAVNPADELRFYALTDPGTGFGSVIASTAATLFVPGFNPTPAAPIVPQRVGTLPYDGTLFVNDRNGGSVIVGISAAGAGTNVTVSRRGSWAVPGGRYVVDMALEPNLNTSLVALDAGCTLHRIDVSDPDAPTALASMSGCPTGAEPVAVAPVRISGAAFAAILYTTGGAPQVALTSLDSPLLYAGLLPSTAPADAVGLAVVFGDRDPVLAVGGGADGLFLYDLSSFADVLAGRAQTLTFLHRLEVSGYQVAGLAPYQELGTDRFLFGKLWAGNLLAGSGGVIVWKLPANLRDYVAQAFIQSLNVNPSGDPVAAVKFLTADITGDVSFEISRDGQTFEPFNCCGIRDISPPSTQIFWRAILRRGSVLPTIDELSLRLDYE